MEVGEGLEAGTEVGEQGWARYTMPEHIWYSLEFCSTVVLGGRMG